MLSLVGPSTPFKLTKNASVYRNTSDVDVTQTSLSPIFLRGEGVVTKCCIYNQFSVVLILHSIRVYFFTCSFFRILYSVLHTKGFIDINSRKNSMIYTQSTHFISSTTPNDYTVLRLSCKSSVFRSRDEFSRYNDAIFSKRRLYTG